MAKKLIALAMVILLSLGLLAACATPATEAAAPATEAAAPATEAAVAKNPAATRKKSTCS